MNDNRNKAFTRIKINDHSGGASITEKKLRAKRIFRKKRQAYVINFCTKLPNKNSTYLWTKRDFHLINCYGIFASFLVANDFDFIYCRDHYLSVQHKGKILRSE